MRVLSTGERVVWAAAYALVVQTSHRREHVIDAIRAWPPSVVEEARRQLAVAWNVRRMDG